jgi:CRP-like cAMP-binding protein
MASSVPPECRRILSGILAGASGLMTYGPAVGGGAEPDIDARLMIGSYAVDSTSPVPLTTTAERPADTARGAGRRTLRELLVAALPGCRAETSERLIEIALLRPLKPGEHLYRQGEPVPLTLILTGYGAARRMTVTGKEIVGGVAPAGVLFGWSGLAAVPSSVEMVALTECEIAQWPGAEVRALALVDPSLGLVAIDSMAWSLHQAVERFEGFLHQDARLRVLRILAQHRALFFGEPAVLTRAHLPGLVGTSREMTGRVLRGLEREGTIARVGRAGLKLLRPDQLEVGSATLDVDRR